jgi:PKD repeat protein
MWITGEDSVKALRLCQPTVSRSRKRLIIRVLTLLMLPVSATLHAITPTTKPATTKPITTEPWRPTADAKPAFTVLLSPGVAPCAVHVNALRFPLATGTPLSARYVWNFGDPGGSYNALPGFNAAHVYDQPGEYTITLTVTDQAGVEKSATAHIVISPDRRNEIFVSPAGSDLNIGTNPDAPLHSIGKACKIMPNGCSIRLKAGCTYDADSTLKISKSDVLIGRYGDGPDPVVMLLKQAGPKPPHGFFSIDSGCNGVTLEQLTFDTTERAIDTAEAPKIGIDAIVARGRNVTVRNCTFLNVDNAVNANGSPMGLLVMGCKAPLKTGLRAYFVWTQGSDFVCLGNSAANSTREHIVRLTGVQRALIADNDFTNLDRRPADKYDTSKGTIEMHNGSYAYIAHNRVTGGTIRVGPLGLKEDPSTATDWSVIESNQLSQTYIVAYPGSHHVMIRNNIIRNDTVQAIQLQAPDEDGRTDGDIQILDNTAIDNGQSGAFLKVWGHVNGIDLRNNLLVAPHLKTGTSGAAAVNIAEPDLSSFSAIGHNLWPAFGSTECMVDNKPVSQTEWDKMPPVQGDLFADVTVDEKGKPSPGSKTEAAGVPLASVVFDLMGVRRSAHPTIGAMEISSKP